LRRLHCDYRDRSRVARERFAAGRRALVAGAISAGLARPLACAGLAVLVAHGPGSARAQTPRTPAFSDRARQRLVDGPEAVPETFEREHLLRLKDAEALLASGQAAAALEVLERAALTIHSADVELTLVRAQMAMGRYRRALAACAHVAGGHREQSGGKALYAWLLSVGGQQKVAMHLISEAATGAPDDRLLQHAREQIAAPWPLAGDLLRQGPWHAAPVPFAGTESDAAPESLRVVGTAVLLREGQEALLTETTAAGTGRIWLRNALGQTVAVVARQPTHEPELHLLALRDALPSPDWTCAAREPFAGSPGSMVEYVPDPLGRAAWPLLRQGFFAGLPGALPTRPLGFDVPPGPRGGPVFDAAGCLVGVAAAAQAGRLIGLGRLREVLGSGIPDATPSASPTPRVGPEAVYEMAMRGTLQVLVR
jgi:hypothetical protein